ncbi:TPA: hypothetical protein K8N36_000932 [Clostridium perfringens]|uniref:Phage protein n=1 Tax=Clostridium perfringens F262 TaxID=883064 RepID=A0AAV3FE29_CLOPF|nr:hypothetical protein [Clostridium perfringens]UWG10009.1 MAG: hypothetical protein [Bacteriophage sp.]EIA17573.1 hypothetical protein HA1_06322 [Clostridium perfringens F262]MDK0680563.1 hypothetical protein [Clostridium perfringens]MDK0856768.1 hypothetical protein [Clostridium perfringens]MDM0592806.1 hypothetical protein [Clostridium perfringens]
MILSDVSKRIIKTDDVEKAIDIFGKSIVEKCKTNIRMGEFERKSCYEIEIIYPVGDYFYKEDTKNTKFKKDESIKELMEAMCEELKKYFEITTKYMANIETFEFLAKVCTYYGYTIKDLKEKLIKKEDMRRFETVFEELSNKKR